MKRLRSAIILLAIAGLGYGGWLGWNSEALRLRVVEVGGNHKISKEEVAEVSGLVPGTHLLRLSTHEVADRVESLAWIRDARVERIVPSKVRITITERAPVARVSLAAANYLADEEGVILEEGSEAPVVIVGLPLERLNPGDRITLAQYRHALSVANQLDPPIRERLARIRAATVDGIVLELGDGTTILYGAAEGISEKNFAIGALIEEAAATGAQIASIDVRVPRRPAVRRR